MAIATIGIDLGKNSCSLAGLGATGAVVLRHRLSRGKLVEFLERVPPCVVAMEACCGAHHLGRQFAAQGHEVRLMAPYVAPYVKAQKTDDRDAEAIAEAATRPTMRFVALKTEAQLDQQTLHRLRSRLVNGAHAPHQPAEGDPARARDHGGERPPCPGSRARDAARRRGIWVEPADP
jgi:transposase